MNSRMSPFINKEFKLVLLITSIFIIGILLPNMSRFWEFCIGSVMGGIIFFGALFIQITHPEEK